MKNNKLVSVVLALSFGFAVCIYLWAGHRGTLLTLNKQAAIEVNGTTVRGEVLEGRLNAIVTRRDATVQHSYRLFFEADTDASGDTGFVVDCHDWVAPDIPILIETAGYPPCKRLAVNRGSEVRWPLINKGPFVQFVSSEGETIRIRQR